MTADGDSTDATTEVPKEENKVNDVIKNNCDFNDLVEAIFGNITFMSCKIIFFFLESL
jgi:hypothetical protein